jgi:serine/threonine protein kinase
LLNKYNKKLILARPVYNEISNCKITDKNINHAIKIIKYLIENNLTFIENSFNTNTSYYSMIALFYKMIPRYNTCLISANNENSDKNLAKEITHLKNNQPDQLVKYFIAFHLEHEDIKRYEYEFKFNLPKKLILGKIVKNTSINTPKEKDTVYDDNGKIYTLKKQIGKGGEGSVYLIDYEDYICKIYKKEKNTSFKEDKIKLLIKSNIYIDNVCFPEVIINNKEGNFVGYLMKKAIGEEIKTSIFIPKLFNKKFPTWGQLDIAKLVLNILTTVIEIHNKNIIIGDVNPSNILVNNDGRIFFIDTDSYQVESYPCPVGFITYTKPLHHGKNYSDYLRTKDDDIFAVMTLVFQIFMQGIKPYSFKGGGNEKENMKIATNFPYNCKDGDEYHRVPEGDWYSRWLSLPKDLRDLFCLTFKSNKDIKLEKIIIILKKEETNKIIIISKEEETNNIILAKILNSYQKKYWSPRKNNDLNRDIKKITINEISRYIAEENTNWSVKNILIESKNILYLVNNATSEMQNKEIELEIKRRINKKMREGKLSNRKLIKFEAYIKHFEKKLNKNIKLFSPVDAIYIKEKIYVAISKLKKERLEKERREKERLEKKQNNNLLLDIFLMILLMLIILIYN